MHISILPWGLQTGVGGAIVCYVDIALYIALLGLALAIIRNEQLIHEED